MCSLQLSIDRALRFHNAVPDTAGAVAYTTYRSTLIFYCMLLLTFHFNPS